jgi:hypothetical protein
MMILKNFVFCLFFIFPVLLNSQIGIELLGNKNEYKSWNDVIYNYSGKESKMFKYSYGIGVNYWFRLESYRLEFTPGVYYMYSRFKFPDSECKFEYNTQVAGAEFDMNIYMFDFVGRNYKRDCPTFSHDGEWFKKSFFIQVSPGLFGAFRSVKNSVDNIEDMNIAGKFDFGFGLDIKISDHLIVAPVIKYGLYIGEKWNGFSEFHAERSYNDITPGNYVNLVFNFYLK